MSKSGGRIPHALSLAEDRLRGELPAILDLGQGETLAVGRAWNMVSVAAMPDRAPCIALTSPWMAIVPPARLRTAIERAVDDAFGLLARQRAWRICGTDGPPVSLLHTNTLWDALVAAGRLRPQDLVDRVHRQVRDPDAGIEDSRVPIGWWRNGRAAPGPLARLADLRAAHVIARGDNEPWMAGRLLGDGVVATAYAPEDGFTVRMAGGTRSGGRTLPTYEIRTTARLPETVATGSVGRSVASIVREDVVDVLGGTIVAAAQASRTLNLRVRVEDAPPALALAEHRDEFDWQLEVLNYRRAAVADEIERAFRR